MNHSGGSTFNGRFTPFSLLFFSVPFKLKLFPTPLWPSSAMQCYNQVFFFFFDSKCHMLLSEVAGDTSSRLNKGLTLWHRQPECPDLWMHHLEQALVKTEVLLTAAVTWRRCFTHFIFHILSLYLQYSLFKTTTF